ncbi:hypothetical protein [Pseudoxanthomonas sp. PXM02]|uniref:hypothetical protein n=1 Tax=Pseudoxanthomonas sp. PXM02 TaxID=2769294 RepID=UPI0017875984|nr:hypothetical protein [Pseudoxanthomonas sp. PXM02]MBD9481021.1 hypothetical protein [Pseudoxanthomonas sp. PXM02]
MARAHGRRFSRASNRSVMQQLEADEAYFLTTLGHCDCDEPVGALHLGKPEDWDETARKLARKGWSEGKIARAVAQKREQAEAADGVKRRHADDDLARWRAFVDAVLSSGQTDRLGLLLHVYSGTLDDEPVVIRERRPVGRTEDRAGLLYGMEEDVLYLFHA